MIQYEDIRNIRPIAENLLDLKRLKPYIEEVEKLLLMPAFGASLFRKIDEEREMYGELYSGGYYDDGKRWFAGLSAAAGYLVYSRLVRDQSCNVTAFGVVQKVSQYSEPMDERTVVRMSNDAENIGVEYLNQCLDYLRFIGELTNDCCCHHNNKRIKTLKIKAI